MENSDEEHSTGAQRSNPLLKAAAFDIAQREGRTTVVSNIPITEVKLAELYFWLAPFGPRTNLDVWDETQGEAKVLNINWGRDDTVEIVSFRRGEWENVLIKNARQNLH